MSYILPAKIDKIVLVFFIIGKIFTCLRVNIAVIFSFTFSLINSLITFLVDFPFVKVIGILT